MDRTFLKENNTFVLSFRSNNFKEAAKRTKKERKKYKKEGFHIIDHSMLILRENIISSTLVFSKK